jgi:hypothetical protein
MKTYLVWYVIQTITKADEDVSGLGAMIWIDTSDTKTNPIFKSNKIKVDKISLPSIYKHLAKKNNIWAGDITILWVSKLD